MTAGCMPGAHLSLGHPTKAILKSNLARSAMLISQDNGARVPMPVPRPTPSSWPSSAGTTIAAGRTPDLATNGTFNSNGNCATCHVPAMALDNPFNADPREASGAAGEGVFCDLCHKIDTARIDSNG